MKKILLKTLLVLILISEIAQAQLTWRLQALPRDGELGQVAFGAGKFVALTGAYEAEGNFVAVSSDGASWQLVPIGEGTDSIASSGNNFVITYGGNGGHLYSSSNGTAWTPIGLPSEATNLNGYLGEIAFSGGRYFFAAVRYVDAGDDTYTPQNLLIFAPANLTSWSVRTMDLPDFPEYVAYGSNQFIASVREGSDFWIYSSTDGASWTKRASLGTSGPTKIRFLNNRFIAVGRNGSIWVSTDGITWSKKISPSSFDLIDASFGKGLYVVLAQTGHIMVSSDANTWKLSPFGGFWSKLRSIAFGGNRFLVTGPKEAVLRSN